MKKNLLLLLISLFFSHEALAQSSNDLFERIDPYQQPAPAVNNPPSQQPGAQAYPYPQATQYNYAQPGQQTAPGYPQPQGYQQPQTYPAYQPPAPVNPDAVKVFGNDFDFKNLLPGQTPQQPQGYVEPPIWQNPSTIMPGEEEKNYETRLKEGMDKPLPKRPTTLGDDHIDELRDRVNSLKVPRVQK